MWTSFTQTKTMSLITKNHVATYYSQQDIKIKKLIHLTISLDFFMTSVLILNFNYVTYKHVIFFLKWTHFIGLYTKAYDEYIWGHKHCQTLLF